jgi:hypothetical protein
VQVVAEVEDEYLPLGQREHDEEAGKEEKVPGSQSTHCEVEAA